MGKKIIIANWKMNKSLKEAASFLSRLNTKRVRKNTSVIIAPSFPLLSLTAHFKKKVAIAGQDVSVEKSGARTGEVSAAQLKDVGCTYCLVGHSEQRVYHNETDELVRQKIQRLLEKKITPILCFGENAKEKKAGKTRQVLKKQLSAALKGVKDPSKILFAYEPVWAISTFQKGKPQAASTKDIVQTHIAIRQIIQSLYSKKKPLQIQVLYGGSVTPNNAQEILSLQSVDGALVGGASLKISSFTAILKTIK